MQTNFTKKQLQDPEIKILKESWENVYTVECVIPHAQPFKYWETS